MHFTIVVASLWALAAASPVQMGTDGSYGKYSPYASYSPYDGGVDKAGKKVQMDTHMKRTASTPSINQANYKLEKYVSYTPYYDYQTYHGSAGKEAVHEVGHINKGTSAAKTKRGVTANGDDIEDANSAMQNVRLVNHGANEVSTRDIPSGQEMGTEKANDRVFLPDLWYGSYNPYEKYPTYDPYPEAVEAEAKKEA